MATVQQSIEIRVPVRAAYHQLTHFEDYPNFMEEVKSVQQTDDRHLHSTTIMANRPVEWDAEIIEQEPDRCIAWRNVSGPTNAGRVELQPTGADAARIVVTLESQPEQVPGSMAGNSEEDMAQRLKLDLVRLKDFIEARGAVGASQGQSGGKTGSADAQEGRGSPRNSPVPTSSYAAGSEGFAGDEAPTAPVTSSSRSAAQQRNDTAGSVSSPQQSTNPETQTDTMRHAGTATSGTAEKPMQQDQQGNANLKQSSGNAGLQSPAERGQQPGAGQTAGGTDALAGARMAGGPATKDKPGASSDAATAGTTEMPDASRDGGGSPAAGAAAAGGTGLGEADMGADAGDTRAVPREGTTGAAGGTGGGSSAGPVGAGKP